MNTSILLDTRHAGKIGFLSFFVYGQDLAEKDGSLFEPPVIGDPSHLIESLDILGLDRVKPIFYQNESRQIVANYIRNLIKTGLLEIQRRSMLTCSCQKVRIPSDAILYRTSSSLIDKGIASCCNSSLTPYEDLVIQTLPICFPKADIVSHPYWSKNELQNMRDNFKDKRLVLSRNFRTDIVVNIDGVDFQIDNDFFVYLSPVLKHTAPSHVVAGTSLVKQMTLYTYFSNLINESATKCTELHFLPRANYTDQMNILDLCRKFGNNRVRSRLLSIAKNRKQVISFGDSSI